MTAFDRKLGASFLEKLPCLPGVYRFFDSDGKIIYIGKAKNLKRRLSQYRNPKRRKKHRKMRKIVEDASSVEFQVCQTELEAVLLETQLIQQFRPKWNVVGAFFFLYPMIGIKYTEQGIYFCYTTQPEHFSGFSFHGAFRSRDLTREAFFSLMKILNYVGHSISNAKSEFHSIPKYSYIYGFRQLPEDLNPHWEAFWKGESKEILEYLILNLVENAGARKNSKAIQLLFQSLARFWKHEACPLFRARNLSQYLNYPVSQKDRDLIFLKIRHL